MYQNQVPGISCEDKVLTRVMVSVRVVTFVDILEVYVHTEYYMYACKREDGEYRLKLDKNKKKEYPGIQGTRYDGPYTSRVWRLRVRALASAGSRAKCQRTCPLLLVHTGIWYDM